MHKQTSLIYDVVFQKKPLTQNEIRHYIRLRSYLTASTKHQLKIAGLVFVPIAVIIVLIDFARQGDIVSGFGFLFLLLVTYLIKRFLDSRGALWKLFYPQVFDPQKQFVLATTKGLTFYLDTPRYPSRIIPWTDYIEWKASQTMIILLHTKTRKQEIFLKRNFDTAKDWDCFLRLVRGYIVLGQQFVVLD